MDIVLNKPLHKGDKVKEYGLIIRLSSDDCSDKERDDRRAQAIKKVIEWKLAETAEI